MRALDDSFSVIPIQQRKSQFRLRFGIGKSPVDLEEKGLARVKRSGLDATHSCRGGHKNEPGYGY
jgi:hypothetical protein